MPSPEHQPPTPTEVGQQLEQPRFRTIAVRVQEDLHAELSFIAQLSGSSISEEIRQAIERRITAAGNDPELIARAEQVRDEIERDAATRTAAIAGFMGKRAVSIAADSPKTRRRPKTTSE